MTTISAVLGDITAQTTHAIVNAASVQMRGGGGVDGAIHRAAGPDLLKECVARFPDGLPTGQAGWTPAGNLAARYVIHTPGPNYAAGQRDRALLESSYKQSLKVAEELGVQSISFPLLSAGIYGWPLEDAVRVAVESLAGAATTVEDIQIVVLDPQIRDLVADEIARFQD